MIVLEDGVANKVALTLTEKTTILSDPYYLFRVVNDDTNTELIFTATDVSTNTNRYNEFLIEVNLSPEDLLDGKIELTTKGYYKYYIYEQVSPTNLDLNNVTGEVERGKLYYDTTVNPELKEYTEESDTKYVYNG